MHSAVRFLVLCGPVVILVIVIALAQLTEGTPPVDDDVALLVSSLLLGMVLQGFFIAFWRNARTAFLERAGRWSLVALILSVLVYGTVLTTFSVRRDDDRNVRAPLGIVYTADFHAYLQDHPDATARAWVAGGDRPDLVYTSGSLGFIKILFAALWLAVTQSFMVCCACTCLVIFRREAWYHPQLAILRERMELWPEAETRDLRAALDAAMRTLVENSNRHGAILTVAPLFEGREGFLGLVAAAAGANLERSLWADQIEELRLAGHLPPHVASELHSIRVYSNDARHNKRRLSFDDARRTLESAVRCEEWYLYEFPRGPLFPRADASGRVPPDRTSSPRTA